MRSHEFGFGMRRYIVYIAFSENASAPTVVFADTPENAWLIAANQFGVGNIVSVKDAQRPTRSKPVDKPSALQFWADRFRKFARLARPEPQQITFADQANRLEKDRSDRLLAKTKAVKAKREFQRVARQK
jgi:hypothetical protein